MKSLRYLVPLSCLLLLSTVSSPCEASSRSHANPDIHLVVDIRDTRHGVLIVEEQLSVVPGSLELLFPEWIQGSHSPSGPAANVAGLTISANGKTILWRRSSRNVYAFSLKIPKGVRRLDIQFEALTNPWTSLGGWTELTEVMGRVQWNRTVLYPRGANVSSTTVSAEVFLPHGWKYATPLESDPQQQDHVVFKDTSLATLIDSPVYAGLFLRQIQLSNPGERRVTANFFGDTIEDTNVPPEEIDREKRMVAQAYLLYGPPHYRHYDLMVPLSTTLHPRGLEHLECSEDGWSPNFITDRDYSLDSRDRLTHEFTHSWNGKFRRPEGLTSENFNTPLDDSLLWVYEGATSYWGVVLAARSGMWTKQEVRDLIALHAADYELTSGKTWRSLSDTTNDPVLATTGRTYWSDWQRSYDFYNIANLMWLGIDLRIRELTHDHHSLDDFARFFLKGDSAQAQDSYTFDDVVQALNRVAPYDWKRYLLARVNEVDGSNLLVDDLSRGGYRLIYNNTPSAYERAAEHRGNGLDLTYSLGISVNAEGNIDRVVWNSEAFRAGLTLGARILTVGNQPFSTADLLKAVADSQAAKRGIDLGMAFGKSQEQVHIDYDKGLRYPHLELVGTSPNRLDQILEPLP